MDRRLLVADAVGAIYSLGLDSGTSERIAVGVGSGIGLAAIAYDSTTNSVLLLEDSPARLIAK